MPSATEIVRGILENQARRKELNQLFNANKSHREPRVSVSEIIQKIPSEWDIYASRCQQVLALSGAKQELEMIRDELIPDAVVKEGGIPETWDELAAVSLYRTAEYRWFEGVFVKEDGGDAESEQHGVNVDIGGTIPYYYGVSMAAVARGELSFKSDYESSNFKRNMITDPLFRAGLAQETKNGVRFNDDAILVYLHTSLAGRKDWEGSRGTRLRRGYDEGVCILDQTAQKLPVLIAQVAIEAGLFLD